MKTYISLASTFIFGFIYEQTGQALSLFLLSIIGLSVVLLLGKFEFVRVKK